MDCGICIQNFKDTPEIKPFFTECLHSFCKECFEEWEKVCEKENKNVVCPMCRHLIKKFVPVSDVELEEDQEYEDFEEVSEEEDDEMDWEEDEPRISYLQSMNNISEEDYHYIQNQRYEREFYGQVYTY